jgi:hypothetical protein
MLPQTKNPPCGGSGGVHFVPVQNLKMDLSSASISSDRFFSFSRYCGVKASLADRCSSLTTTDRRELFNSVSMRWTLLRSRLLESSLAMIASYTGGLWSGLRSWSHTGAARFLFRGDYRTWQGKSELPKNSTICPINQVKTLVIGQSLVNVLSR